MTTKKKIIRRKEIRKDYVVSLRFTEADIKEYEQKAIEQQISLAEFLRKTIHKGIAKPKKQ
jgi:predicted DNA binding CopG/RHH family protein